MNNFINKLLIMLSFVIVLLGCESEKALLKEKQRLNNYWFGKDYNDIKSEFGKPIGIISDSCSVLPDGCLFDTVIYIYHIKTSDARFSSKLNVATNKYEKQQAETIFDELLFYTDSSSRIFKVSKTDKPVFQNGKVYFLNNVRNKLY